MIRNSLFLKNIMENVLNLFLREELIKQIYLDTVIYTYMGYIYGYKNKTNKKY